MERNKKVYPSILKPTVLHMSAQECPILCITKSVIFLTVAVFILYLPLGDPSEHCYNSTSRNNCGVVCNLCDIHDFLLKVSRRTADVAQVLSCVLLDALYEAKLKFYSLLEKIDRNDLCRSVCCAVDVEENQDGREKHSRPPCRCIKRKCRK